MIDLKAFRKKNNLTQSELGEYIGIKKSFISAIENGRTGLPDDKFNKLINNDKGWDISPLLTNNLSKKDENEQTIVTDNDWLKALRESQRLHAKSQEQIDRLLGIIETLTKKQ